jgi:drug/metabolite transporter (DMT)-like permease
MGQFLVILSAFGFSTLGVFGKLAYEAQFTRNQMLLWRFGLALPFLALILAINRAFPKNAVQFLKAVALGFFGIGFEATFYFLTLEHLGASLTGIFLYLFPTFVALISCFLLKEGLSVKKWVCIGLSLIGSVFTSGVIGGGEAGTINPISDPLGLFFGLATAFTYAGYILIGSRISKNENPLTVSSGIVLGAFLIFGLLSLIEVRQGTPLQMPKEFPSWYGIIGMAIMGSVLPFTTLYAGMKRVGAMTASILSTLELVFTIGLAAAFLGEKLTLAQGFGAGLVLLSILLATLIR